MKTIKLNFFKKYFAAAIILLGIVPNAPAAVSCSQCGRSIVSGQQYFMYKSKIFCSQKCIISQLPRCAACGKTINGRYLVSDRKNYCSRKCLSTIMPECTVCGKRSFNGGIYSMDHTFFACPECMKLPKCFSCSMPVRQGQLSDGRPICKKCSASAVSQLSEAKQLFYKVRRHLREEPGIGTSHNIRFSLVDQQTLHRLSANSATSGGSPEQGLFRLDATIQETTKGYFSKTKTTRKLVDAKYTIYILDHLPRERMEYVIAHELAHDWMSEYFRGIRELWIKEGVAQYIAWLYNKKHGYRELNIRIEKEPDPIYGDGFRKIRKIADEHGFSGLKQFLRKQQKGISNI